MANGGDAIRKALSDWGLREPLIEFITKAEGVLAEGDSVRWADVRAMEAAYRAIGEALYTAKGAAA